MTLTKKLLPILVFAFLFIFVFFTVSPPASLTKASLTQIIFFFVPLFLLLASLLNLFFQFWIRSLVISFGIILILIFESLGALNILSFVLVILGTILITKSFKKQKQPYFTKIPKLSKLQKQR